ncbi:MAG TPA: DUF1501 domain-containing protein [Planctomycetota bacterium]|nr:DUF1501 domain-containing protein [Planctomycetota bacterium]
MDHFEDSLRILRRRTFLGRAARGVGSFALASLLFPDLFPAGAPPREGAGPGPGGMEALHGLPRAKRVIYLTMAGGPSHLETFDHKPKLARLHGEPMPESVTRGQPIAQLQGAKLTCFGPQYPFARHGRSGQEMSSIFPYLGRIADDMCIIRSMRTEAINHDPAHTFMNTGTTISGRPAMGSWLLYGLGADAQDLPGFVVLTSLGKFGQGQPIASRQWHSGYLPSEFQGVEFFSRGDPVLYVSSPKGVTAGRQRDVVSAVGSLNRLRDEVVDDPEIATRIAQYEMAFRMQASVPGLMDLSGERSETLEMYGTKGADGSFAANCLLARRLAERGVRFIQLYHRGWDHHGGIKRNVLGTASEVDQASWALVTDLKARGLFDDTLVVWGGEFGRTPMAQGDGRDHHIKGFSIWMAGGGVRGGVTYGATDELGYHAVEDPVDVRDLHATILHLLGIRHDRFTYKFQGLDMRLTGVEEARVVKEVLA